MFEKTLGIVLSSVPYSDNTQFVHIYTERFGKITYKTAIKQLRKRAQPRMMFAPLTLLELDVEHNENAELQKIKEASIISSPLTLCPSPVYFFVAELVDKSIREVEANPMLWDFLKKSLDMLSMLEFSNENFHLVFMAKLFTPLGFGIDYSEYKEGMQFDMNEGKFTSSPIAHAYYLNTISAKYLYKLLKTDYDTLDNLKLNKQERAIMLDILLAFLKIHIPEIGTINSVEIFSTVSQLDEPSNPET